MDSIAHRSFLNGVEGFGVVVKKSVRREFPPIWTYVEWMIFDMWKGRRFIFSSQFYKLVYSCFVPVVQKKNINKIMIKIINQIAGVFLIPLTIITELESFLLSLLVICKFCSHLSLNVFFIGPIQPASLKGKP